MTGLAKIPTQSSEKSLRDLGLHQDWMASHGLPSRATSRAIEAALNATRAETVPADDKAFAVCILDLVKFGRTFGCLDTGATDLTVFYRSALADIPADLLAEAIDGVKRSWRWGNRMPLPADLRAIVAEEFDRRLSARAVLERALRKSREAKPQAVGMQFTDEQLANARAFIARKRAQAEEIRRDSWGDDFVDGRA